MGCGTSSNAVGSQDAANGHPKMANGNDNGTVNGRGNHDDDDLPTVVLPDTPVKPKPPIAFEIPIEEFEGAKRVSSPPPHLQRLLQPPQPEISLPDIREKLAGAEQRRMSILQQRAASAQKRTQKMMKLPDIDGDIDIERDHVENNNMKHGTSPLTIPPEPGVCEDKNIT